MSSAERFNLDVDTMSDEDAQNEIARLMNEFDFSRVSVEFERIMIDGKQEILGSVVFYYKETPNVGLVPQEFIDYKSALRLEKLILLHGITQYN